MKKITLDGRGQEENHWEVGATPLSQMDSHVTISYIRIPCKILVIELI
jgi:hypothetical protein